jgi:hypothetical protein
MTYQGRIEVRFRLGVEGIQFGEHIDAIGLHGVETVEGGSGVASMFGENIDVAMRVEDGLGVEVADRRWKFLLIRVREEDLPLHAGHSDAGVRFEDPVEAKIPPIVFLAIAEIGDDQVSLVVAGDVFPVHINGIGDVNPVGRAISFGRIDASVLVHREDAWDIA